MAKVRYGVETLPKISIAWVGCTNVTDRWQTDSQCVARPSQPQSVTALWPVPSYTAWWQRHTGVSSLLISPLCNGVEAELEPVTYKLQVSCPTDSATVPWCCVLIIAVTWLAACLVLDLFIPRPCLCLELLRPQLTLCCKYYIGLQYLLWSCLDLDCKVSLLTKCNNEHILCMFFSVL